MLGEPSRFAAIPAIEYYNLSNYNRKVWYNFELSATSLRPLRSTKAKVSVSWRFWRDPGRNPKWQWLKLETLTGSKEGSWLYPLSSINIQRHRTSKITSRAKICSTGGGSSAATNNSISVTLSSFFLSASSSVLLSFLLACFLWAQSSN